MPTITDTITTADGTCPVTLATPDGDGPWPGVIIYPDAGRRPATFARWPRSWPATATPCWCRTSTTATGDWAPFDMNTAFGDPEERKRLMSMMGSVTPE